MSPARLTLPVHLHADDGAKRETSSVMDNTQQHKQQQQQQQQRQQQQQQHKQEQQRQKLQKQQQQQPARARVGFYELLFLWAPGGLRGQTKHPSAQRPQVTPSLPPPQRNRVLKYKVRFLKCNIFAGINLA